MLCFNSPLRRYISFQWRTLVLLTEVPPKVPHLREWSPNQPVTRLKAWDHRLSPSLCQSPTSSTSFPSSVTLWALPSFPSHFATVFAETFPPGLLSQNHNWSPDSHLLSSNPASLPSEWSYKSVLCLKSAAMSHFKNKVPTPQHGIPKTSCCSPIFFSNLFCQNPYMLLTSQLQNCSQFL